MGPQKFGNQDSYCGEAVGATSYTGKLFDKALNVLIVIVTFLISYSVITVCRVVVALLLLSYIQELMLVCIACLYGFVLHRFPSFTDYLVLSKR